METPEHFKGKDPLGHVAEAQIQGKAAAAEIHGTEMSGYYYALADAARDTAIALGLLWMFLFQLQLDFRTLVLYMTLFAAGWLFWKAGRSAWLGWARLERLHRVIAQEKWEIEHHRQQERDELKALYGAKGFQGKLLEDVVDVLMADGDRLLRVMVEEEMGYTLETHEHPLQQALGAALGVLFSAVVCIGALFIASSWGVPVAVCSTVALAASMAALRERNKVIPALVWNLALTIFVGGLVYYLLAFFGR